jgi:hypothetical protein
MTNTSSGVVYSQSSIIREQPPGSRRAGKRFSFFSLSNVDQSQRNGRALNILARSRQILILFPLLRPPFSSAAAELIRPMTGRESLKRKAIKLSCRTRAARQSSLRTNPAITFIETAACLASTISFRRAQC